MKDKRNVFVIMLMLPAIVYALLYLFTNYGYYFSLKNNDVGIFNFIRILFVGISYVLSRDIFKKNREYLINRTNTYMDFQYNRIVMFSYIIAIAFYFLGYVKTTIMRVGLYFGFFEVLFIALVCKRGRGRQISMLLYSIFVIFYFVTNSITGWSGLADYSSWLL